jgi:arylsulfatase
MIGPVRVAMLLGLAIVAGCSHTAPPNVVVVLVDTLRPDRLGVYGNSQGLTPSIDALATEATVFRNSYAQSSWTNPSVASLFTSRFQSQHHVISFGSKLDASEETLAELLQARGYATAGFVANILLQQKNGFGQGFDFWKNIVRPDPDAPAGKMAFLKGRGDNVNEAVFGWLDERSDRKQPVFLYVHYMETHAPYDPPEATVAAQRGDDPPPDRDAVNMHMELPGLPLPDRLLPDTWALYDAEVVSVDAAIGRLFEGLRARGVLEDAVLVFLADHGEEFKEHGLVGHNQSLYDEVIRVPLIIAATGRPAARTVDGLASVIDVAPTVLELIGSPVPPQFEGRSRAPEIGAPHWWTSLWRSAPSESPRAFSELIKTPETLRLNPHERAVVTADSTKLITGVGGERDYYDLRADPGEHDPNGLAAGQRAALDQSVSQLVALGGRAAPLNTPVLDAETRERMRALGYAE